MALIALLHSACNTEEYFDHNTADAYLLADPDVNPFGLIYYVAPSGDDANDGSKDLPFKSVEKALTLVAPGDIIYLRDGKHELTTPIEPYGLRITGVDGEPGNPIKLWAYPGEHPVFVPADPQVTNVGIYWHIRGLEVTGVKQRLKADGSATFVIGFQAKNASGNIFEALESHHNEGIGFHLSGKSTGNLVLNSDFHHNADPHTVGYAYGHADGIHIRVEFPGTINWVKGCRSWNNSDDGYDTWWTSGLVIFEESWAFWNGYEEGTSTDLGGDGNGFKLGPYTDNGIAPDLTIPLRIVTRSLAFQNLARGFDQNGNGGRMLMHLFNNSSFENLHGYVFNDPVKYVIKNNLSLNDESNGFNPAAEQSNNSWNMGFAVSPGDFISVDPTGMNDARGFDGSLPATNFLKPAPGSTLIDAGAYTGHPYMGSAPDIGSRESGS